MHIRYSVSPETAGTFQTGDLRNHFLMSPIFTEGLVSSFYYLEDRILVMGAVPADDPLPLPDSPDVTGTETLLERRELGIINLGGPGTISRDEKTWSLEPMDCLYLGRGSGPVLFSSRTLEDPARFYMISTPAHRDVPDQHATHATAAHVKLGSSETASNRDLYKYIHPEGIQSCQLVMGYTAIAPGSVWNTMPPHRHLRRSEVYLYFDLPQEQAVFHFMGAPEETRHLVVRRDEAVFSPGWSIHGGAGTAGYKFVWAMAGENQAFTDMDALAIAELY